MLRVSKQPWGDLGADTSQNWHVALKTFCAEWTAGMQDKEDDVVRPSSGNPRRTKRVQFTCNLCGETTTKMVNPHAWEKGTVFAQCSGCNVKHKLIGACSQSIPHSNLHTQCSRHMIWGHLLASPECSFVKYSDGTCEKRLW